MLLKQFVFQTSLVFGRALSHFRYGFLITAQQCWLSFCLYPTLSYDLLSQMFHFKLKRQHAIPQ